MLPFPLSLGAGLSTSKTDQLTPIGRSRQCPEWRGTASERSQPYGSYERVLTRFTVPAVGAPEYRTVRFTLNYDGPLVSRGNASRQATDTAKRSTRSFANSGHMSRCPAHLAFLQAAEPNEISVLLQRGGHVFAPLVCKPLHPLAEIDILMLRPELPGGIVTSGGDIDNRLKTLFDALRVPGVPQEIASDTSPSSANEPHFTLLEDDALIARINVETDRLLAAPDPSQVRLIIRVNIRASRVIYEQSSSALINTFNAYGSTLARSQCGSIRVPASLP